MDSELSEGIPNYLSDFLSQGDYVGIPGEILCVPGSEFVIVQPSSHFLNHPELYIYNQATKSWHLQDSSGSFGGLHNIQGKEVLTKNPSQMKFGSGNTGQSSNEVERRMNISASSDEDNEQSSLEDESSESSVYSGGADVSEQGEDLSLADIAEPDPILFHEALEDITDLNEDHHENYTKDIYERKKPETFSVTEWNKETHDMHCTTNVNNESEEVAVVQQYTRPQVVTEKTLSPPNYFESCSQDEPNNQRESNHLTKGTGNSSSEKTKVNQGDVIREKLIYYSNLNSLEDEIPMLPIIPPKESPVVIQPIREENKQYMPPKGSRSKSSVPSVSIIPIKTPFSHHQRSRVHNNSHKGSNERRSSKFTPKLNQNSAVTAERMKTVTRIRCGQSANTLLRQEKYLKNSNSIPSTGSQTSLASTLSINSKGKQKAEQNDAPPVVIPIFSKKSSSTGSDEKSTALQTKASGTPVTISLITENNKPASKKK